jgi:hypothetical protein
MWTSTMAHYGHGWAYKPFCWNSTVRTSKCLPLLLQSKKNTHDMVKIDLSSTMEINKRLTTICDMFILGKKQLNCSNNTVMSW